MGGGGMRICLASAPTITEFRNLGPIAREDAPRIPLGALSLVGELERSGLRPELVDLDRLYAAWSARGRAGDFTRHAVGRLAKSGAEVYGFSTICSSYPLTLRLATALKKARPDSRVLLGGPQATATADETLAAFPAVDVVVRGEGERTLPALLEALAASRDLSAVPGLTFRSGDGVVRTADAPLVEDLDSLALPSYGPYMRERRYGSVPLEVGRGCPFSCTFCSTSPFFGRRFRMKSPERIVEDMLVLHRRFGARHFDLVHDNFTVDRRRVVAFCQAVSAAEAQFTWSCSSRTDYLDDDLIEVMHRAGCRAMFLGLESGSEAVQRITNKRLDPRWARHVVQELSRRGINSSVSFIVGFPDETREDLRSTVSFFVNGLRQDLVEPQIGLLSPLAGSPMHARHRHELVGDDIVSALVFQGERQDSRDRALVVRHPEVFSSFYSVPTRWLDRAELHELCRFLIETRFAFRWLLVAAAQLEGDGLDAFLAFRAWRSARSSARPASLSSASIRADFIRFARGELARRHPSAAHALRALARYYACVSRTKARRDSLERGAIGPRHAAGIIVTPIDCDGPALIRCLRTGGDLSAVPRQRSVLLTRQLRTEDRLDAVEEPVAALLGLCDGTQSVEAITRAFRRLYPLVGGVPGERAARFGLQLLVRKRLVTLPKALRRSARAAPSSR